MRWPKRTSVSTELLAALALACLVPAWSGCAGKRVAAQPTAAATAPAPAPAAAPKEPLAPVPQGQYIDGIIAKVAGRIILYSELSTRMAQARSNEGSADACVELEDLLYAQLLLEQARIDSVVPDENQVNAELESRLAYFEQQLGGREKMEKFYGKPVAEMKADFHDQVAEQMLTRQMGQKIVGEARVTPKEVERFYREIPKDSLPFINASVEFARIVRYATPTEEEERRVKKKMEEYRQSLVDGTKDFCTLAILYSEDPGSASKCGELGMVPRGRMVPEFDAVALSLKDGQISPVFKSSFGYHIMQMIDRKGERYNARHILLSTKVSPADQRAAKAYLDSVMTLVRDGEIDFSKAATDLNDDEETKGSNGLVIEPNTSSPQWAIGDLQREAFQVLDKLQPGQISEAQAFEEPDGRKGYRVYRLIKRTEPHKMDLVQDYPTIQQAAEGRTRQRVVDTWVKDKVRNTYVYIVPDYASCPFQHPWAEPAAE